MIPHLMFTRSVTCVKCPIIQMGCKKGPGSAKIEFYAGISLFLKIYMATPKIRREAIRRPKKYPELKTPSSSIEL